MKNADDSPSGRGLPLGAVLLCLVASGSASLALEVVWSRLLVLIFGSSTQAVTTTLVATMLGFGLGGLAGGRLARRVSNGVRAYGFMELGVGLYALLVPFLVRFVPGVDDALVGVLGAGSAPYVRFLLALALLLLPTMAMGATLPLLIGTVARTDAVVGARTGLLYGINTLGAVLGVLGATFVGFPLLGLSGTNTFAAGLDVLAGLVAIFLLAPRVLPATPRETDAGRERPSRISGRLVVSAYALVGATALAYEVGWTRALAMVVGSSTYAFATMLAGFLAGIALGSLAVHRVLDRLRNPGRVFGIGVVVLGLAAYAVSASLDRLPDLFLSTFASVGITGANLVRLGFVVSFLVLLGPTLVLGALFPLCVRTLVSSGTEKARAVGVVYFANTLGSAAGAFTMGFVLIPRLGLETALGVVVGLDLALGALLLFSAGRGSERAGVVQFVAPVAVVLALVAVVRPPAWDVDQLSEGVYYRATSRLDFGLDEIPMPEITADELLFYEEGRSATISVYRTEGGLDEGGISMRINGKTDASLGDMSTQVLSGHLPFLFGGPVEDVLVIGYASSVTTGAVTLHDVSRVDVCEIEPAIVGASHFFDDYNHRPLKDPRVHLHLEDGRSFLQASDRQWDVVISEPSNPWMSGCANLFTREFFELTRERLRPGGRLLQWVQLYGMEPDGLRAILAAVHESFSHVHGFLYDAGSSDLLLIASDRPLDVDDAPVLEALSLDVRRDLARVRVLTTGDLWSLVALAPDDLRALADEADVVNSDDNLYVELTAPLHLYDDTPETSELLRARASGIAGFEGVVERAPVEVLAETAVSYLERRGAFELADGLREGLESRGDAAGMALFDAVRILVRGGSSADASRLLDEAVRRAPDRFLPRVQRAWFANQRRQYDAALRDLEQALTWRPDHTEAAHQRSKALAASGRVDEARIATSQLLAGPLRETEPQLIAEAAFLEAAGGDLDAACATMREFLALKPYSPREWQMLAGWERERGEATSADAALESAARAHANRVRNYHWIARWHENYGTREEALGALRVALRLDPENPLLLADLERLEGPGS